MLRMLLEYASEFGRDGTMWANRDEAVYYPVSWVRMEITNAPNGGYIYTESVYGRVVVSAAGVADAVRAWTSAVHRWAAK